jgi:hypothetical protein
MSRESLEREIGALHDEMREGFKQVGKHLDRVESAVLHMDGRLSALSRADIQTDQQLSEMQFRQHAQRQAIDDLTERVKKLENEK